MQAKSISLVWIVVKDFKKAVKFYTEVVGLKLKEMNEEWGWAELEGHEKEGMRLGIAQQCADEQDHIQPGQNAIITVTVENIEKAIQDLQKQGADLIGKLEEVPGHVKMQTIKDTEGNFFQIVEVTTKSTHPTHAHTSSCCH